MFAFLRSTTAERAAHNGAPHVAADAGPEPHVEAPVVEPAPTREEQRLAFWTRLWGMSFALEALVYLSWVFAGPAASRPFAVNSVAKDVTWTVLALLVAGNVRRFGRLVYLLVLGHVAIIGLLTVLVLTGNTASNFPNAPAFVLDWFPSLATPANLRLPLWLGAAMIPAVMLAWLGSKASRSRYRLRYLSPTEFETVVALADASLEDPQVPPEEIAARVDRYWAAFETRDHRRLKLALWLVNLWPLTTFRAPLVLMDRDARRAYVERRLLADLQAGRIPRPARRVVQAALRFATQLMYAGYYGDSRTHTFTGYERFVDRDGAKKALETVHPNPRPLRTIPPREVPDATLEADVVIVGSGAGGAVVAHELVKRGRDVLIVERGRHVDPSQFTDDELSMYSHLYSDGALQLARDFAFQVVQGMCVGGSTVVNNAVCIDLPQDVLDRWNGAGIDAGLPSTLAPHFQAVRRLVGASSLPEIIGRSALPEGVVSRGANKVVQGVRALRLDLPPNRFGPVDANIDACLGCGNCNVGCPYGMKLSMLDRLLPQTQHDAAGRLRILSQCEATRVDRDGSTATGVTCRLAGEQPRTIHVRARDAVVVAAGAIHSSRLLQDSGIAKGRAGHGLCANIAAYMTADFDDRVESYKGLQITHVLEPPVEQGYAIETWFNPVMSQALLMPGWLGQHQQNMARYEHMTCAGVVVGSQPNGRVLGRYSLTRRILGTDYALTPAPDDFERVVTGLRQAGEILFAAGAKRVMPPTFKYREYTNSAELEELDRIRDSLDLSLNTAHPQGGNAVSADASRGVVDPTLRVHGHDNLYVCDASVFPTGITVNPQLTVMAVAHYAATNPQGLGAV
jgi:choline dehydrogenase-like flavoprotein